MNKEWKIVGRIGNIRKVKNCYAVDIVKNSYKKDELGNVIQKDNIWFNILCSFEPKYKIGDKVVASGIFAPTVNKNYNFCLFAKEIKSINDIN